VHLVIFYQYFRYNPRYIQQLMMAFLIYCIVGAGTIPYLYTEIMTSEGFFKLTAVIVIDNLNYTISHKNETLYFLCNFVRNQWILMLLHC